MRLRSKPWAERELTENPAHIDEPESLKGKWKETFQNENEIYVEIGCGKGTFILKNAIENPDKNFIAIERSRKIIAMAVRMARENGSPSNLRFIAADADRLEEIFAEKEIDRVYINFCDPWRDRKKWHKRRLTHRRYLQIYKKLMGKGSVFFKTDNLPLFEFSLAEVEEIGWRLENVSFDLHNSDYKGNIMTEYETRFKEMGMPIYRLEGYTE